MIAGIVLETIMVFMVGSGLSDTQLLLDNAAAEERAMKDGTYCYSCPSMVSVTWGVVYLKFGFGAALGAAGIVLFLLNRADDKNRMKKQTTENER